MVRALAGALLCVLVAACASTPNPAPEPVIGSAAPQVELPPVVTPTPPPPPPIVVPAPKIALVLGGGAAKGFAHIGVIKTLESLGYTPSMMVGTSAGSVVGVLWAAGHDGFALQRIALEIRESSLSDWSLPNRGFLKGESLREFINQKVERKPLEKLKRTVAVVATDLQSGELMVFQRGDAGTAVQASSSVPGVFQPVTIGGREYVDGGLVSPVPVQVARRMGADIVIAVDISARPALKIVRDTIDVLMQTFTIMGGAIASHELNGADVVVRPDITKLSSTDFKSRHLAILEGERAAQDAVSSLRSKIDEWEERYRAAARAVAHPVLPPER